METYVLFLDLILSSLQGHVHPPLHAMTVMTTACLSHRNIRYHLPSLPISATSLFVIGSHVEHNNAKRPMDEAHCIDSMGVARETPGRKSSVAAGRCCLSRVSAHFTFVIDSGGSVV
jgi:hypothetical protein